MAFGNILSFQIGWVEVGLILALLCLYIYYTWTSAYMYWKRRNVPYLKPSFPFGNFADIILFRKNFHDSWMSVYNEIGNRPFCGTFSVKTPIFVVKDPELIKQIMIKDFSHFTDHGWFINSEHEPLLNNLFHMEGENWKNLRMIIAPAFSGMKMKMMFPLMNGCAQQLKISLENTCKGTGKFESRDLMSRYTIDVIMNCVFGLNANSVINPDCDFYKTGRHMFERSFKRIFSNIMLLQVPIIYSLLKLHFIDYDASQHFADLMTRVMEEREKKNITRNDFVDLLIRLKNNLSIEDDDMFSSQSTDFQVRTANGDKENGKPANALTMNDLLAQALTFFFAGFETTANTLTFCLYELSTRPDIQLKIQKEVDAALQRHGSFTYQMMKELPYIDNVLKETLRRYGALVTQNRVCVKSYKVPDTDIIIEKGCKVVIPHHAMHHDPKYYPDPFNFDPDRFLEENVKSRPACTYMPFGDGPRLCIGNRFATMEMRLALSTLFSEFSCKRNSKTPVPVTIAHGDVLTTTNDNVLIDIKRRT